MSHGQTHCAMGRERILELASVCVTKLAKVAERGFSHHRIDRSHHLSKLCQIMSLSHNKYEYLLSLFNRIPHSISWQLIKFGAMNVIIIIIIIDIITFAGLS